MHYHKVSGGAYPVYAAHREKGITRTPDVSQVGYIRKGAKGWYVETPHGFPIGDCYPTEKAAQEALEAHANLTVARATWMK